MIKTLTTIFTLVFVLICSSGFSQQKKGNFWLQQFFNDHGHEDTNVGVMLRGNGQLIQKNIKNFGGIYKGTTQGWYYVRIPANRLQDFMNEGYVSHVNFNGYKGVPLNDTMRVNNRINPLHDPNNVFGTAFSGEGILLGFIDTGISWDHPDFLNPDSSTRVMYLWDQTQAVNQYTPLDYGYGQHWDSALINQNIPTHTDQWGHGSTVTGTACGNAFATGKFKGVAPNADIISVEVNFNAANWLSTVVDAAQYIFDIADSIGKPCVINASVGEYLGSHDGLDPYALYIDSLINAKPGRLFVCAGGNSGLWGDYHLHTDVNSDTSFTMFQINPSSAFGIPAVFFEVWADKNEFDNVQFALGADKLSPAHSLRARTGFHNIQDGLYTLVFDTIKNSNGDALATVQMWAEEQGDQYLLQVMLPQPDSTGYHYRFESTGSGSFDVWSTSNLGLSNMIDNPPYNGFDGTYYVNPDSLQTIVSSFQCSPHTITVGNYVNDTGYVNIYGNWLDEGGTRGALAPSSSIGPTRTGLMKPDVAASGQTTVSAYPMFRLVTVWGSANEYLLADGGYHYRNGGTSMASPVVAGIGALMLERCPDLTPQRFKEAVMNSTYSDGYTGALPNYAFGYGKVDGYEILKHVKFTPSIMGDMSLCAGQQTTLDVSAYESALWSDGSTDLTHNYDSLMNGYVTVVDQFSCPSDTGFFSLSAQTYTLTQSLDSLWTDQGLAYQWFLDGTAISGSIAYLHIATQNGLYHVVVDENGCLTSSDTLFFNEASISESQLSGVLIYPNPTEREINISISKSCSLAVFDLQGRRIAGFNSVKPNSILQLNELNPGTYFIHEIGNQNYHIHKIVVIR